MDVDDDGRTSGGHRPGRRQAGRGAVVLIAKCPGLNVAALLGEWMPLPLPPRPVRPRAAGVAQPASAIVRPAFGLERQGQSNWCWSAVSVSVRRFHDAAARLLQCELAQRLLPGASMCCVDGTTVGCNQPYQLDRALKDVRCLAGSRSGATAFADLLTEIAGNRPLCCFIDWGSSVGHFVTVTACWRIASGAEFVSVADPTTGSTRDMPIATLRDAYAGAGRWTWSYLTKPPPAPGMPSARVTLSANSPVGG